MPDVTCVDGSLFIVDEYDYERVVQYSKWSDTGKAIRATIDPQIRVHHFILGTKEQIDHKDRNYRNNKRDNLRFATYQGNAANREKQGGTYSSKYKGVSWFKMYKKWRAYITVDYKFIHLGYFDAEEDAARAYDKAALEYFGEFAALNLIGES